MVDTRIKVVIPYTKGKSDADYLWIDIFPIDGNPNDYDELVHFYRRVKQLRKIVALKTARVGRGKTFLKRILKPIIKLGLMMFDTYSLCAKIDKEAQRYPFENSEYIGGVLWGYGPQEKIHKKEYLLPISVSFEGESFNAPSNYDEYLTNLYHDYMQLPPVEKRITHEMAVYMNS